MVYMKVYCGYCGQTWEIYPRDDLTRKTARKCPHCDAAKIDPETWEDIVSCLIRTKRVNERLAADHVNKHNAIFAVSFVSDHLFSCPVSDLEIPDNCPNID